MRTRYRKTVALAAWIAPGRNLLQKQEMPTSILLCPRNSSGLTEAECPLSKRLTAPSFILKRSGLETPSFSFTRLPALADLFFAAESGRRLAHKKAT
jgi:hypothetical protein